MDVPVDQVQPPFLSHSRYRALVLDPGMQPIDVVNWQRALVLDMLAKVEVLEYYPDVTVNSVSAEFFLPAVLMAKKVGRNASKFSRVPLNRRNIMIRDNLTCQYCGKKPSRGKVMSGLTLDHIVPQCRNGGVGVVVVSVLPPPLRVSRACFLLVNHDAYDSTAEHVDQPRHGVQRVQHAESRPAFERTQVDEAVEHPQGAQSVRSDHAACYAWLGPRASGRNPRRMVKLSVLQWRGQRLIAAPRKRFVQ